MHVAYSKPPLGHTLVILVFTSTGVLILQVPSAVHFIIGTAGAGSCAAGAGSCAAGAAGAGAGAAACAATMAAN